MAPVTANRGRRIVIWIISILLLLSTAAYFALRYKLKDIVAEIVLLESGGSCKIEITKFSFSLRKNYFRIKKARLICIKPSPKNVYYGADLPEVYVSINSWESIFRQRKIAIDSLYLSEPHIQVNQLGAQTLNSNADRPVAEAIEALQKVRNQLAIRSIKIADASISVQRQNDDKTPFAASNISFSLIGTKQKNKLSVGASPDDHIDFSIQKQHWTFPNGTAVNYRGLSYNQESGSFQVDSFSISRQGTSSGGQIGFLAEKLRLTVFDIADIYVNDRFYLDSIFVTQPYLRHAIPEKKTNGDSTQDLSAALSRLLGNVNIKHISVEDGKLALTRIGKKGASYSSKSTDLLLSDLEINRETLPHIVIGDIQLQLNEVDLATADSQYMLRIKDFALNDNNLICKNASFEPTAKNKLNSDLQINMPSLTLYEVSLPDILENRLKASSGLIAAATVTITPIQRKNVGTGTSAYRLQRLYHSLNGLAQLILVDRLQIRNSSIEIKPADSSYAYVEFKNVNAGIELNNFLQSEALLDMKDAIPSMGIEKINIETRGLNARISDFVLKGSEQRNYIEKISILTKAGIRLMGSKLFWERFNWDRAMNDKEIYMDSVDLKSLLIEVDPKKSKSLGGPEKRKLPSFLNIRRINVEEAYFFDNIGEDANLSSQLDNIQFEGLNIDERDIRWQHLAARFRNIDFTKRGISLKIGSGVWKSDESVLLKDISYQGEGNSIKLKSASLFSSINTLNLQALHFNSINIENPVLEIREAFPANRVNRKGLFTFPLKGISADIVHSSPGIIQLMDSSNSPVFSTSFALDGKSMAINPQADGSIVFDQMEINLSNSEYKRTGAEALIPRLSFTMKKGGVFQTGAERIIKGAISGNWSDGAFRLKRDTSSDFRISRVNGRFQNDNFIFDLKKKPSFREWIRNIDLTDAVLGFQNRKMKVDADSVSWNGESSTLQTGSMSILPLMGRNDFFEKSVWQKDYVQFTTAGSELTGLDLDKFRTDSALSVKTITLHSPKIYTSRNKTIPFLHGREKLMPTKLITSLSFPLKIDSLVINNGQVEVNEVSELTGREGNISISDLDAILRNISNKELVDDSLSVAAKGLLFGNEVKSFKYRESYSDSLSGFRLSMRMSKMDLTALTQVTNPLAAVNIERGSADTLVARVSGNKYAAYGEMQFFFNDLKIKMLDHKDTAKRNFLLSFENLFANSLVLRSKNQEKSTIFFWRDREKFIFNFWLKSIFSGVLTGAGVKSNKKFERQYNSVKNAYSLPDGRE